MSRVFISGSNDLKFDEQPIFCTMHVRSAYKNGISSNCNLITICFFQNILYFCD